MRRILISHPHPEISLVAPVEGGRLLGLYDVQPRLSSKRAYVKAGGRRPDGGVPDRSPSTSACGTWRSSARFRSKGPDAAAFVDYLITRDVHTRVPPMQARYVILCNQHGGIINDPVLLSASPTTSSGSASRTRTFCCGRKGVNSTGRFNAEVREIDVSAGSDTGPQVRAAHGKTVRAAHPGYSILRAHS